MVARSGTGAAVGRGEAAAERRLRYRPVVMSTDPAASRIEWRVRPSAARLRWVAAAFGDDARVRRVRSMHGGRAMAVDALAIEDAGGRLHRVVLRRWARPGWAEDDPHFTPAREAAVLGRLAEAGFAAMAGVDVPLVLAEDPDGQVDGVPALLQTRLPGRPRRRTAPLPVGAVRRLAEILVVINDLDAGLDALVTDYRPFAEVESIRPPAATTRRALWERALALVRVPPVRGTGRFMHRDYHPGNALWEGSRLTGIVDWTQASWGPPAADLGQLRVNLAADHSVELADVAREAYWVAGGHLEDAAYWDIRTLLDWLPDLDDEYAAGPGLERLERYLAAVLAAA